MSQYFLPVNAGFPTMLHTQVKFYIDKLLLPKISTSDNNCTYFGSWVHYYKNKAILFGLIMPQEPS
jgi:hypothetical protein